MSALRFLNKAELWACYVLLVAFVSLVFLQVLLRELFDIGIPATEELARYAFVWFVFLSASFSAQQGSHNRVVMHLERLPRNARRYMLLLSDLLWIGFNLLLAVSSLDVLRDLEEFPYHSPALGWSLANVFLVFPVALSLMSLRIAQLRIRAFLAAEDESGDRAR